MRSRRFEDRLGLKKCPFIELSERRKCSLPPCADSLPVSSGTGVLKLKLIGTLLEKFTYSLKS